MWRRKGYTTRATVMRVININIMLNLSELYYFRGKRPHQDLSQMETKFEFAIIPLAINVREIKLANSFQ